MRFLASLLLTLFATLSFAQTVPTVTFTGTPMSGISPLSVTFTWSSTNAQSCMAGGAWSGAKATSGTQVVSGVLTTGTYTLTCSQGSGSAVVSWTPPTTNTDGTPLTNLASYKIFHATTSAGVASATPITVTAPASSYTITGLPAGVRYYGAKATNTADVDSVMSSIATNTVVLASASASVTITVGTQPNPPTVVTVQMAVFDLNWRGQVGRYVGTIELGTSCIELVKETKRGADYWSVPRELVTLDENERPPRSEVLVARCEAV